jgi:hypothetical protein
MFQISCKLHGSHIPERRKKAIVGLLPPIPFKGYGKVDRIRNEDITTEQRIFSLNQKIEEMERNGRSVSKEWMERAFLNNL